MPQQYPMAIVKVKDGRAVMMRDPDVGGFVELWQPTK